MGELADLVGGVLRVVAADVEEVADVVGLEDLDDALEVLVLPLLELVPAGADAAGGGRGPQQGDLLAGVAERSISSSLRTPSMPKWPAKTVPNWPGWRRQVR